MSEPLKFCYLRRSEEAASPPPKGGGGGSDPRVKHELI